MSLHVEFVDDPTEKVTFYKALLTLEEGHFGSFPVKPPIGEGLKNEV